MKQKTKRNRKEVIVDVFRNISLLNVNLSDSWFSYKMRIWTIVKNCVAIDKESNCLVVWKAQIYFIIHFSVIRPRLLRWKCNNLEWHLAPLEWKLGIFPHYHCVSAPGKPSELCVTQQTPALYVGIDSPLAMC